jgi:DNA-binding transcriptional ArsR family regulator
MSTRGTEALFEALADSTRRAAVVALIAQPHTSGELARSLNVTPQALTRHLRVLRRAGIAKVEGDDRDARLRVYRIDPSSLDPLRRWLDDAERLWSVQLAAFKAYVEGESR